MKNKVSDGNKLTVTAPADVVAGQLIRIDQLTGVVENDAKSGQPVVIDRRGVFSLPKNDSEAIGLGKAVYTAGGGDVTSVSGTTVVRVGVAVAAAATSATSVRVTLVD